MHVIDKMEIIITPIIILSFREDCCTDQIMGLLVKIKKNIEIQNRIVPSNKTNIRSIE